ncbi:MAG: dihydroorotase [Christensenellaceae bacterium]|nr:dihydroorotase [Christensenellaceae bacterium]
MKKIEPIDLSQVRSNIDNNDFLTPGKLTDHISEKLAERIGIPFHFLKNCIIIPGLVDVHVHLREPGFSYKETIKSGSMAAAHGGFTAICPMPNLDPVPDCEENLDKQLQIIESDAAVRVIPYGSITVGEKGEMLSNMEQISQSVIAFSDDGRGVQREEIMRRAMLEAKRLGKIIVAHCEDNSLLNGGYIHDGEYARLNGHKGICSESEWKQVERDLALVRETGCAYHICHISTKETVELIRRGKAEGLDITCETAPHYLVFNDMDLKDEGRFKMNPPIRSESDRLALIEGIMDGTIDMIATDHAPHSVEEKSRGLKGSLNGIVGLETAFSVLYTELVKSGIITLERLVELMSINPRKRFGIDIGEDYTVFETESPYVIDSGNFLSMGKSSPFTGMQVYGRCVLTVCNGSIAWMDNALINMEE